MKNKLTHNWGLKLLSLLMAFVLWCLVARFGDPPDTKSFSNIPVRLINTELLDAEGKVYEILDNTNVVRVTVSGAKSVIDNLRASDISAEADMSKLTDINTIAIRADVLNMDISEIKTDHEVVRLNVEEKKTKWIRVSYNVLGEVADGYVVSSASPDQTMIEISGPESQVNQVSYAYVELDVTGASNNISANVEVSLFDKDGKELDTGRITKNVNYIHMEVEILACKEVPVEVQVTGTPKAGYLLTGDIEQSLDTVKIAGAFYAVANVNKIVLPAELLDVTDRTESLTRQINLSNYLPANVKLVENDYYGKIIVTVLVEAAVKKTLEVPAINCRIKGVPEGLSVSVAEETDKCKLEISGLSRRLTQLSAVDVRGEVDFEAWMKDEKINNLSPGAIYTVPVTFLLEDGITQLNECSISVRVLSTETEE